MEIEDRVPIHLLYRDLILSAAAFGAHRWLAALQRACERCACLATAGMPHRDIAAAGGVFVSDELIGRACIYSSSVNLIKSYYLQ
jgi:hypothetical protein